MRVLAACLPILSAVDAARGSCRCTPPAPCWDAVPWATLNASIGGRLAVSVDPLAICSADAHSAACDVALNASDDEFWLSAQPNG